MISTSPRRLSDPASRSDSVTQTATRPGTVGRRTLQGFKLVALPEHGPLWQAGVTASTVTGRGRADCVQPEARQQLEKGPALRIAVTVRVEMVTGSRTYKLGFCVWPGSALGTSMCEQACGQCSQQLCNGCQCDVRHFVCFACCVYVANLSPHQSDQCCKMCARSLKECFSKCCPDSADRTAVADKAAAVDGVPSVSQAPNAPPGQMNMV